VSFNPQATHVYNGIDLTLNGRLLHNVLLQGGISDGHEVTDDCQVFDTPGVPRVCKVDPPFQPNVRFLGWVPLKWGLQASPTLQSLPRPMIQSNYVVTTAQIAPPLGRNLAAGADATVMVPLIAPGREYGDRLNQLNFRVARKFKVGGWQASTI
jgi:hypothetical protein